MARILLLPLLFYTNSAFNLDTQAPIIKVGGAYQDSYFGYSVAQHVNKYGDPSIIVGAPRDKNLQPGTARSGAIYRCGVSLRTRDCVQVETDGRRHNQGRLYGIYDGNITELKSPLASEIKEDQWLGVSLSSQGPGGKVIVCAHRYSVRDVDQASKRPIDSKRAMLGMCYILEHDLSLPRDTNIGAKNLLVVREALRGKRLQLINDFDNHAKFGVCQVGTACAWARNFESSQKESYALFGAPGCFTWRGNLLGQKAGTTGSYESAVRKDNNLDYTKHGHLGLAVTSGRYFDEDLRYVSAAPHYSLTGTGSGEVYFYSRNSVTSRLELEAGRTLKGGTFGAGFGYSLETVDLNGDGWDDLVVGAPFTQHSGGGEGGSVFIYLNQDNSFHSQKFIEIRGAKIASQFGLSIAQLGDINKDGFNDLAVGAPYEGQGVVYIFLGAVEGISGLKKNQFVVSAAKCASQIISGQQLAMNKPLPTNLVTFGSSLSGGLDLDNNEYPDLVIGSFGSNAVVLLLARPIINISTRVEDAELLAIDPGQSGCSRDVGSSMTCFHFSACFRLESRSFRGMTIRFKIVAEPNKQVSRVWLTLGETGDSGQASRNKVVEHNLLIQDGGKDYCTSILGYLSNYQTDLQTPVKFSLSYTLVQEKPQVNYDTGEPMIDMDRFPILNQQQAQRTFFARFQKNCGEDSICQAHLIIHPSLADINGELARSPNGIYQLELGNLPDNIVILKVKIKNIGEAAYEAKLNVVFPASISYIGLAEKSNITEISIVNNTMLTVDLGNPFRGRTEKEPQNELELSIKFMPKSVINETLISFEFVAETSSELVVDSSTFLHCIIVRRAEVDIVGRGSPSTIFYGGTIRGESALRDVAEIGPQLKHVFQVSNKGPSEIDVATVNIKWPYQVENGKYQGKWLLYLVEYPLLKNGRGGCSLAKNFRPNPLNLTSKNDSPPMYRVASDNPFSNASATGLTSLSFSEQLQQTGGNNNPFVQAFDRQRREIEQIVAPISLLGVDADVGNDLIVRLDCDRGTAKCLTITCQVYNLQARDSVIIEVKSRLWNSTLLEDYGRSVDKVEIVSKASVIIDSVYTQDLTNDFQSVISVARPDLQLEPIQSLDWWIYIVAAAVGLLLLVFIIIVLKRVGFFNRYRPTSNDSDDDDTEFMVSANFEKVHLNS